MKDAFYFPHDSNAKDDPKCVLLVEQLGLEGYGIYWILIETLRDQPGYKYPLALLPAIARRYNTTLEKVKTVVSNYGLFIIAENDFFLSESLCVRMEKYDNQREKNRLAGKASAEKKKLLSTRVEQVFNECSTGVEQVFNIKEESRREENRVEEKRVKYIKIEREINARERAAHLNDDLQKRKESFKNELAPFVEIYGREMLNAFFSYWTEPNKSKTKMGFELQRTWDTSRRLATWASRDDGYKPAKVTGKLLTYDEMCREVSATNPMDNYICVEVNGRKLWRRK